MHQRSPHPRRFAARPSRASVRLRPMSQNLLEAKFCAKPSGSSSARPWFTMPTLVPRFTRPSSAPAELSHLMRRGSPAQSLLAMTTVVARAMKTPARHTGCGKEEQPVPHAERRVAACSFRCAPAAVPGGPDTGHASEAVMSCAQCPGALAPSMRHMHRANAWRRLVPGPPETRRRRRARGSVVSSVARPLRCLDQFPTASFSSRHNHGPQGHPSSRRRRDSSKRGRRPLPPGSELLASPEAETVLPSSLCELRRDTSHWFSGSQSRAQEKMKTAVSALTR